MFVSVCKCPIKFVDIFRCIFQPTSIEIGNHFRTESDCAPNSVSSESGKQLGVIHAAKLMLSQLFKRSRCSANVIHCVPIFLH